MTAKTSGSWKELYLPFFSSSPVVVGVGIIGENREDGGQYWLKTPEGPKRQLLPGANPDVSGSLIARLLKPGQDQAEWYTSSDTGDPALFRSSLLVPVELLQGGRVILRIDIDGSLLIEPLQWQDTRTRLVLFDRQGITVFANGITLPRIRVLEKFIHTGPCEAYSSIKVTRESPEQMAGFVTSPVKSHTGDEPCAILREAFQRVTELEQSINYRILSRGYKRWVTATPIPSTGWYLSISILEKDILGPVINQAILSASLIALALVLTLFCLWTVSGRITRPLNRLKQQMNEYATPNGSEPADGSRDEARSLTRSFSRLVDRLGEREKALYLARANNIGHLVQQLRGSYFYFNLNPQGVISHASPLCHRSTWLSGRRISGTDAGLPDQIEDQ